MMLRRGALVCALLFLAACSGNPSPGDGGSLPNPDACVAHCSGRVCGSNGCGGTCGTCTGATTCDEGSGQCVCAKTCGTSKVCGDDGCGGQCGLCPAATACNEAQGTCESCTPSCGGKVCGLDPNGCSCGLCAAWMECSAAGHCQKPYNGDGGLDASTTLPDDSGTPPGLDAATPAGLDAAGPGQDAAAIVPGTWTDYQTFVSTFANAYCDKLAQCQAMDLKQKADCLTVYTALLSSTAIRESLQSGGRVFDLNQAAACLSFVGTMPCDPGADAWAAACGAFFDDTALAPQQGAGATCYSPADCKDPRAFCVGPACTKTCASHQGWLPLGALCTSGGKDCDDSLGRCLWQQNADGGFFYACSVFKSTGQGCAADAECGPGNHCDGNAKCRAAVDVGAPCNSNRWCKSTLVCLWGPGDGGYNGHCASQAAGLGEFCTGTEQCATGLFCDTVLHKCLPPIVAVGGACSTKQTCDNAGYCKGASGTTLGVCTVAARVGAGQNCNAVDPLCAAGLYCSFSAGQCISLVGPGGACALSVQCKDFLTCTGGHCAAKLGAGVNCTTGTCLDIYTCNGQTLICEAPGAFRSTCYSDDQCQSYNCGVGTCNAPCLP